MSAVQEAPVLPRRVMLPLAELIAAARLAGGVPLPLRLDAQLTQLGERLGGSGPAVHDELRRAMARADEDGPARLAALGLTPDERLDPGAALALRVLAGGALLVQVDLAVARRGGVVPLRSWFAAGNGVVAQLSTSGGRDYELAWFAPALWVSQFDRAVRVPEAPKEESVVPASVSLPSELLVAGCAAVRAGRPEVLSALAAEHGADGIAEVLTALETTCRGRLRVLVRRRDVQQKPAITTWLLLDDGWRELRPGPVATARLRRREPRGLAHLLAPSIALASGVSR